MKTDLSQLIYGNITVMIRSWRTTNITYCLLLTWKYSHKSIKQVNTGSLENSEPPTLTQAQQQLEFLKHYPAYKW